MSWDPRTALTLYRPIDLCAIATTQAAKSIDNIKIKLEQIKTELNLYKPKEQSFYCERTITVIVSGRTGSDQAINEYTSLDRIKKLETIKFALCIYNAIKEYYTPNICFLKNNFVKQVDSI